MTEIGLWYLTALRFSMSKCVYRTYRTVIIKTDLNTIFLQNILQDSQRARRATFRIYLAPRFDEKGRRYVLEEQRRRFFILDKFTVALNPGMNKVVRNSADSLLTIDFPQSYRELQTDVANQTPDCGIDFAH
ncbi:hemocyanin D chain-like [Folsomia candida]|uniref:hemocyanin D chain-like n=1 Tax=Folsomia candida TaxID=158441 RepID=UPI001604B38F|nr:hemocyanin D chain-like [Folsomia candida]